LFFSQDDDVEFPSDPQTALGLMQLAMNCSKSTESTSATAAAVAPHPPHELAPADARRLLVTAATRGHINAMMALIKASAVRVHVDAPSFEQVLQHLMAAGYWQALFKLLDNEEFPEVVQLSCASVLKLLQQAVARGDLPGAQIFCGKLIALPVMQQLSCDDLMQQLKAAAGDAPLTSHSNWIVELLRSIPAAEQISSDQVAVLLRLAAQRRQLWPHLNQQRAADRQHAACMLQLLKLPAAQQLSSKVVTELLALLLSKHTDVDECTAAFGRLPAAQQLTRKNVTQLLHTAAGAFSEGCDVEPLCSLPAAQQINCFAVAALLRAAVQNHESGHDPFVGPVCGLSAAQQIRPDTVVELLAHAVERCTEHCVLHLCKLPAAQDVSNTRWGSYWTNPE
jgi:hypothetical protein